MGFARLAESAIRNVRGKREHEQLGALDKIAAASIGGALATWNQPIEGEQRNLVHLASRQLINFWHVSQSSESRCSRP
jgi:hypothetical protein